MARRAVVACIVAGLGACAQGNRGEPQDAPLPRADAAIDSNGCSVQPCSILPQCGCNGNTACDVDAFDQAGTACRAINAPGTETSTCGGPMECDRGFVCLGGVSFRACKKYCSGDADCGAPRGKCVYTITDADGDPIADVPKACSSNCEPTDTAAASCPSSMKCTVFTVSTTDYVADCSPAGTMMQGADCTGTTGNGIENRCAKGYQCVKLTTETTFKCRRLCSAPGTTTGCGANNCIGFDPVAMIGGASYGVCGP